MAPNTYSLRPHDPQKHESVRKIYIQNLTDLLHVCLLRGELERAKRAWAILIRCREVDWRSRWHWGLLLLQHTSATSSRSRRSQRPTLQDEGRDAEKWLKSLRLSVPDAERPSLLHALVLHLIKHERYRAALDELETYLPSYPYLQSGPLHTYAGLLCFYLAQNPQNSTQQLTQRVTRARSSPISQPHDSELEDVTLGTQGASQNTSLLRQARSWFGKALSIDPTDEVAQEFIRLIDEPELSDIESDHDEDEHLNDDGEISSESGGSGRVSGSSPVSISSDEDW